MSGTKYTYLVPGHLCKRLPRRTMPVVSADRGRTYACSRAAGSDILKDPHLIKRITPAALNHSGSTACADWAIVGINTSDNRANSRNLIRLCVDHTW